MKDFWLLFFFFCDVFTSQNTSPFLDFSIQHPGLYVDLWFVVSIVPTLRKTPFKSNLFWIVDVFTEFSLNCLRFSESSVADYEYPLLYGWNNLVFSRLLSFIWLYELKLPNIWWINRWHSEKIHTKIVLLNLWRKGVEMSIIIVFLPMLPYW